VTGFWFAVWFPHEAPLTAIVLSICLMFCLMFVLCLSYVCPLVPQGPTAVWLTNATVWVRLRAPPPQTPPLDPSRWKQGLATQGPKFNLLSAQVTGFPAARSKKPHPAGQVQNEHIIKSHLPSDPAPRSMVPKQGYRALQCAAQ
jgi:hypothetical protein